MPVLLLTTTLEIPPSILSRLAEATAGSLSVAVSKIMVIATRGAVWLDASDQPAALVELRSAHNLDTHQSLMLAESIFKVLGEFQGIGASRIYFQISSFPGNTLWKSVDGQAQHAGFST